MNTSRLESREPYELIVIFLIGIKVRSLAILFPLVDITVFNITASYQRSLSVLFSAPNLLPTTFTKFRARGLVQF